MLNIVNLLRLLRDVRIIDVHIPTGRDRST